MGLGIGLGGKEGNVFLFVCFFSRVFFFISGIRCGVILICW